MMSTAGPGARVLVAEDDPGVRETLEAALSFEGHRVTTVPDGAAALTALAEDPPDLLVLDIGMPELDGLEVSRRLRKISDVPILFLSARSDEIDRVLFLQFCLWLKHIDAIDARVAMDGFGRNRFALHRPLASRVHGRIRLPGNVAYHACVSLCQFKRHIAGNRCDTEYVELTR